MDVKTGEPLHSSSPASTTGALTRDCLDAWTYTEIGAVGDIRPCCKIGPLAELGDGDCCDVGSLRNNEAFRELRQSLLSGQLQPLCKNCHFRKSVPTRVLQKRVKAAARRAGEQDLLRPFPVSFFRVDITEKCNLRCDYCAVSSPAYRGVEMTDAIFNRAVALLGELGPGAQVHVNGHGETTFHPRWMDMCRRIIERGFRPYIITNLAKDYSDDEVDLMSRFSEIQVSLDSDDPEMMRNVRKAIRVDNVFATLERIRAAARFGRRRVPHFVFSIGIYDPSVWTMERFLDGLIGRGFNHVTFWDLVDYPHQRLVRPLHHLDPEQQRRARAVLVRVARKLDLEGIHYDFAGDFHAMVPKLTTVDYLRKGIGFAYALLRRPLATLPTLMAMMRQT